MFEEFLDMGWVIYKGGDFPVISDDGMLTIELRHPHVNPKWILVISTLDLTNSELPHTIEIIGLGSNDEIARWHSHDYTENVVDVHDVQNYIRDIMFEEWVTPILEEVNE